jgi:hypothetical protein
MILIQPGVVGRLQAFSEFNIENFETETAGSVAFVQGFGQPDFISPQLGCNMRFPLAKCFDGSSSPGLNVHETVHARQQPARPDSTVKGRHAMILRCGLTSQAYGLEKKPRIVS